jgi:hypothetical protein
VTLVVNSDGEEQRERNRRQRQRMRSLALALALGALVALFYIATIVRLGGNVFNRPF